jgi:hypothetical protein
MAKSPDLKFRYSIGLGDLVACFLHSKPIGWLTHLITGNSSPCTVCSKRRQALNIAFPIEFWKLFFKSKLDLLETLAAEYRAQGYKANVDPVTEQISVSKFTDIDNSVVDDYENHKKRLGNDQKEKHQQQTDNGDYFLLEENSKEIGNLLIQTYYYKRK